MAHGKKHSPNSGTVREDKLLTEIVDAVSEVFTDVDGFVEAALARAEKLVAANRTEAVDARAKIAGVERRRASLADRLRDPAVPEAAVRAIYKELAADEDELGSKKCWPTWATRQT